MQGCVVLHLFRLACIFVSLSIFLPAVLAQPAMPPMVRAPEEIDMLTKMSAGASEVAAAMLGVAEIGGKPVSRGTPGSANAPKLRDVNIGNDPTKSLNEPTVAANPKAKKHLVAGSHFSPGPSPNDPTGFVNRCAAYRSDDRGANWSGPVLAPHLPFPPSAAPFSRSQSCSDPVIRYAPDGSRVYYSYMDIKTVTDFTAFPTSFTQTIDYDIVVSHSEDNGAAWSAPVLALDGDPYTVTFTPCPSPPFPPGSYCGVVTEPGYVFDKNWIGVHPGASEANWVYVTATRFNTPGFPQIAFTRSGNNGASFSPHITLDGATGITVQGSHPSGGVGGEVLVGWYHSGADGWLNGAFQIRTRRSSNHGATFDPVVTAATDSFELPFWLGPYTMNKRWWGGMFPAVLIDGGGRAHIVYTHDPKANGTCTVPNPPGPPVNIAPCSTDAEDGDIRYISSGPPYGTWSAPWTVNEDGLERAQGYPGLAVQYGGNASAVHVVWEDSRLTPDTPVTAEQASICLFTAPGACDSSNGYYDLFYGRMVSGGLWMPNFRVSEVSSRQDFTFSGDYTDVAANESTLLAVWTDRRYTTNTKSGRDDVFGSAIVAGGGTNK